MVHLIYETHHVNGCRVKRKHLLEIQKWKHVTDATCCNTAWTQI